MDNLMTTQPEFGARVRKRRTELGLSQRQLAGDSVTASYISLLESGQRAPTLDVIIHLAQNLQMPLEELIGLSVDQLLPGSSRGRRPDETQAAPVPQPAVLPTAQILVYSAQEATDFPRAIDSLKSLMKQAQSTGDQTRALEFGFQLQDMLHTNARHEERVSLLEEMLAVEAVQTSAALQVTLLSQLAAAQRDTGRLAEARGSIESARALLETAGLTGEAEHVRLFGVLISTLCELNDLSEVPDLLDEMLRFARRLGIPGLLGRSLWVAAMARSQLGDNEEASDLIIEARGHLSTPTLPLQDWLRFCRSATNILMNAGSLEEARIWLDEADSTTRILSLPSENAALLALRARYEKRAGNLQKALDLYTDLTAAEGGLSGLQLARACLAKAELLRALDRPDKAVEVLREAAGICEENDALQLAVQMWRQIDEIRQG